jgi:hypothetical protein
MIMVISRGTMKINTKIAPINSLQWINGQKTTAHRDAAVPRKRIMDSENSKSK